MVDVLERLTDKALNYLLEVVWVQESVNPNYDLILNSGLAKYKINKGVFSLRNSDAKTLADSAVVKQLISVLKEPIPVTDITPELLSELPLLCFSGIGFPPYKGPIYFRYIDFFSGVFFCYIYLAVVPLLGTPEIVSLDITLDSINGIEQALNSPPINNQLIECEDTLNQGSPIIIWIGLVLFTIGVILIYPSQGSVPPPSDLIT
jgi:hypothetical protein